VAFAVDCATSHKAAGDIRSTRTEVDGDFKRLQGLAGEFGGQWRGQAATGFNSLMTRFGRSSGKASTRLAARSTSTSGDTAVNDLNAVLAQIGAAVGVANSNYQQTEQSNAQMW
jgi:uncharacterized protein YukE